MKEALRNAKFSGDEIEEVHGDLEKPKDDLKKQHSKNKEVETTKDEDVYVIISE